MDADITVASLEPTSIEGIFNTISTVGAMTDAEDEAVEVLEDLRTRLGEIERARPGAPCGAASGRPRVVGLEWLDAAVRDGPLGAGADPSRRWLGAARTRGRAIGRDDVGRGRDVDPEMLVLMPCGFHVDDAVREWKRDSAAGVLARDRRGPPRPGLRCRRIGVLQPARPAGHRRAWRSSPRSSTRIGFVELVADRQLDARRLATCRFALTFDLPVVRPSHIRPRRGVGPRGLGAALPGLRRSGRRERVPPVPAEGGARGARQGRGGGPGRRRRPMRADGRVAAAGRTRRRRGDPGRGRG